MYSGLDNVFSTSSNFSYNWIDNPPISDDFIKYQTATQDLVRNRY